MTQTNHQALHWMELDRRDNGHESNLTISKFNAYMFLVKRVPALRRELEQLKNNGTLKSENKFMLIYSLWKSLI